MIKTLSSVNAGDTRSVSGLGISPGEGNGNPLQCSCLENPRDGRAWWAAVYGVAQSRTGLNRLSSSSSVEKGMAPTLVFLPEEVHGQRSLVYGVEESDTTELLNT